MPPLPAKIRSTPTSRNIQKSRRNRSTKQSSDIVQQLPLAGDTRGTTEARSPGSTTERYNSEIHQTEGLETNMSKAQDAARGNAQNQAFGPVPPTVVRPIFIEYLCGHTAAFQGNIPIFHPAGIVKPGADGVVRVNEGQGKCVVCSFNERVESELQKLQELQISKISKHKAEQANTQPDVPPIAQQAAQAAQQRYDKI